MIAEWTVCMQWSASCTNDLSDLSAVDVFLQPRHIFCPHNPVIIDYDYYKQHKPRQDKTIKGNRERKKYPPLDWNQCIQVALWKVGKPALHLFHLVCSQTYFRAALPLTALRAAHSQRRVYNNTPPLSSCGRPITNRINFKLVSAFQHRPGNTLRNPLRRLSGIFQRAMSD